MKYSFSLNSFVVVQEPRTWALWDRMVAMSSTFIGGPKDSTNATLYKYVDMSAIFAETGKNTLILCPLLVGKAIEELGDCVVGCTTNVDEGGRFGGDGVWY